MNWYAVQYESMSGMSGSLSYLLFYLFLAYFYVYAIVCIHAYGGPVGHATKQWT